MKRMIYSLPELFTVCVALSFVSTKWIKIAKEKQDKLQIVAAVSSVKE